MRGTTKLYRCDFPGCTAETDCRITDLWRWGDFGLRAIRTSYATSISSADSMPWRLSSLKSRGENHQREVHNSEEKL
jgi:hypothetical protein